MPIKKIKKLAKKRSGQQSSKQSTKYFTKQINSTLSKPQNHYAELAPLLEICYYDLITGKKQKQKFPRRKNKMNEDAWVLLWNSETEELLGIKRGRTSDITDLIPESDFKKLKAYKIYKAFNGFEIPQVSLSSLNTPNWEEVGKAEHIVYGPCDKNNQGDFYDYIHPFGDNGYIRIKDHGVKFYYDRNNKIFKLSGGKLTVNERGIVY